MTKPEGVLRDALVFAQGRGFEGFDGALSALRSLVAERDELRKVVAPDAVDGHPCVRVEAYQALRAERDEVVAALRGLAVDWKHIDTSGLPADATIATAVGSLRVSGIRKVQRALTEDDR